MEEWGRSFPVCSGTRQSPINIKTSDVSFTTFEPWKFQGYDQVPEKTVLKNNGHSGKLYSETSHDRAFYEPSELFHKKHTSRPEFIPSCSLPYAEKRFRHKRVRIVNKFAVRRNHSCDNNIQLSRCHKKIPMHKKSRIGGECSVFFQILSSQHPIWETRDGKLQEKQGGRSLAQLQKPSYPRSPLPMNSICAFLSE